jgi:hypothetical protein
MMLDDHDHDPDVRSSTVSALSQLAGHGEFVIACYPDIAKASMKSGFAKKLGR